MQSGLAEAKTEWWWLHGTSLRTERTSEGQTCGAQVHSVDARGVACVSMRVRALFQCVSFDGQCRLNMGGMGGPCPCVYNILVNKPLLCSVRIHLSPDRSCRSRGENAREVRIAIGRKKPMSRVRNARKLERRLALLSTGGEPRGTGTPCTDCEVPRTIFNTSVIWSDQGKTRLTFHYAVCDACRSAKLCKRLRNDPAAKLVQMGADAAARTKRPRYEGAPLAARECTDLIVTLLVEQEGQCASCKHEVRLAAGAGIYMASLDKVGACYDDGTSQVLCLGCQRLFNNLGACDRAELTRAIVHANSAPRPRSVEALPVDFERSVATKVEQMRRREVSTDRPSRGSAVQLSVAAACRRLRRSGLHCVRDRMYHVKHSCMCISDVCCFRVCRWSQTSLSARRRGT